MPSTFSVFLLSLVPVLTTGIGATLSVLWAPGVRSRSAVQHFAAGVIFAIVGVELLPAVVEEHDPIEIGWTFAAGFLVMIGVQLLGKWIASRNVGETTPSRNRLAQRIAIAVDITIDGLLIGIAFAAGSRTGTLLTAALSLELLSLGVATSLSMIAAGSGRTRAVVVPVILSTFLIVGAVVGEVALRGASGHTMAGVLSFGSAALLYLVTEELLVEAHESGDTTFATSMFFAGLLLFLLLGMAK